MKTLLLLGCGPFLFGAAALAATPGTRPNVLLIISDDLNCRLGCYGAAEAKTPNIDRLAARGVRFDRAYCNYPVCNVSRTSFLSGRYPEVTGVLNNNTDPRIRLGADFQFLPEYFRARGYFAAGAGKIAHGTYAATLKWDYYSEPQRGVGEEDGGAAPGRKAKRAAKAGGDRRVAPKTGKGKRTTGLTPDGDVPFGWQATRNADADEPDGQTARRLLKYFSAPGDRPFFIAAGFHKPHVPHTAPEKYFALHEPAKMPTPPEPPGHEKDIPGIARAPHYYPDLPLEKRRAIIQHYYAATSFMDAQVGLLLDELDRLRLWDSTIVVFMSDHGWHLGEHGGFYAKMSVMDESARAPLIVAAPGIRPGVARGLVEYVDVFPTLVDLAGLAKPGGLQGTSCAPLLKNPAAAGREEVYTIVMRGPAREAGRALHTPAYTYMEWPDGSRQLYDAKNDPHEYVNLVRNPQHANTLATMQRAMARRRGELGLKP